MTWETEKFRRTLYIVRLRGGLDNRERYSIHPMSKILKSDGTSYMEPLPKSFLAGGSSDVLRFDKVEFIDPPVMASASSNSALNLNYVTPDSGARSSKP